MLNRIMRRFGYAPIAKGKWDSVDHYSIGGTTFELDISDHELMWVVKCRSRHHPYDYWHKDEFFLCALGNDKDEARVKMAEFANRVRKYITIQVPFNAKIEGNKIDGFIGWIPELVGFVVSGTTEEEIQKELSISIKITIAWANSPSRVRK
jgi:hypothetical protein